MKAILLISTILVSLVCQAQYSFPTGMATTDALKIVESFGVGFMGKQPPTFIDDNSGTQLSLAWNWVNTNKVSKLGNGNSNRSIQYQELYFTQELPYQVEFGLHANLLMLNNSVTTYGGFTRWTFAKTPIGALAIRGHGTSASYRNLMGINMTGGLLEADFYAGAFMVTAGLGQIRTTAQFKASVFGLTGDQPLVRAGDSYVHQMVRITYVSGRWNLSAQSDRIREAHNGLLLGYVF